MSAPLEDEARSSQTNEQNFEGHSSESLTLKHTPIGENELKDQFYTAS